MHSDVENSEEKEPVEDSEGKRSRAFSWVYTRVYEDFWVSLWPFLIILSNCLDVLPFLLRPPHTSGSVHAIGFPLQVNRPKDTFLRTAPTTASTARQPGQEFYMEQRESTMEEENMVTSTRKKIPGCEKTPGQLQKMDMNYT